MRRAALYSSASRAPKAAPAAPEPPPTRRSGLERLRARRKPLLAGAAVVLAAAALFLAGRAMRPASSPALTPEQFAAAVLRTLSTHSLPSKTAAAAESVRRSVVRIRGYEGGGDPKHGIPGGVDTGSGVVIIDDGTILTCLHVVRGAKRLKVTFYDGSESDAVLVGAEPDHDLAVIRAERIPDDLPPATLGSASRLRPGDGVVAVGFPFGVGPSVSAGVVSGVNREFRADDGRPVLKGLIQFDAAVNPGSSGGPLVTLDGEVVGIVTAILNPTQMPTFAGIGFATTMEAAGPAVGMPPF